MKVKALIAALGLSAFAMGAQGAVIVQPFTVDEGAIEGTPPGSTVTADQLAFRYGATVVQVEDGGVTSFRETGFFDATGFVLGNTTQTTWLNSPEPSGYGLYGLFEVTGTIQFIGTTALATFTAGNVFLYADPSNDTTFSIGPGAAAATVTDGNGDDQLLASSLQVLSGSQANVPLITDPDDPSKGSYVINYGELTLTALGEEFFIEPLDFYLNVQVTGENETFDPPLQSGNYIGLLEGDGSAGFYSVAVPEPTILTLLGLGLLGFGLGGRRRSA